MSVVTVLVVIFVIVPLAASVVFGLGYLAYGIVARDVARRLHTRAELFDRGSRCPELIPGLRYAAETVDCWGRR